MLLEMGDINRTFVTVEFLDFIRRASPTAPAGVALGARSAIRARFSPGEFEDRMIRPWVKIIWSLAGVGTVRLSGRVHRLPADRVAVFFPGMLHEAWAGEHSSAVWEARWVTMDGPLCGAFASLVGLRRAGIYSPRCDLRPIFDRYRDGIATATPDGAREAELAAHSLLASLESGVSSLAEPGDPVASEALSLMRMNWPDANFGVAQAAVRIKVHRSVLSRRFHAAVGISPRQHLMDLRMSNALILLRSTDLSIQKVALQCGFSDAGYFTRLFHRAQGMTPKHYRAERN